MKRLVHDIHKGKNIQKNLMLYRDRVVQTYYEYGALDLTFSAYTLLEEVSERETEPAHTEKGAISSILRVLGELAQENCVYRDVADEMKELRKEITDKMEFFTSYVDSLICYEYVLNRMELKFLPEQELTEILRGFREEEFLWRLKEYLLGSKDQSVIQDKIRLLISHIPIYMTKNKLLGKIGDALTLYKDSERSSLDEFVYILRSSAMLNEPKKYAGEYTDVEEGLKRLQQVDYVNMTKEEYDELVKVAERTMQSVKELTDFYYSLQKVVNGIYAMCLLSPYVETEHKSVQTARSIWAGLANGEYRAEMLVPLEGRIEECVDKSDYLESVLDEIKASYKEELEELSLTQFFVDFTLVVNLLSDSLFIDLEHVGDKEMADADYVQQCTEQLLEELSLKFSQLSRPVKRVVMSRLLEKMPVMFRNVQEIEEFIRVNLFGCQDRAEKAAVMLLLRDLMQEEKEWS